MEQIKPPHVKYYQWAAMLRYDLHYPVCIRIRAEPKVASQMRIFFYLSDILSWSSAHVTLSLQLVCLRIRIITRRPPSSILLAEWPQTVGVRRNLTKHLMHTNLQHLRSIMKITEPP